MFKVIVYSYNPVPGTSECLQHMKFRKQAKHDTLTISMTETIILSQTFFHPFYLDSCAAVLRARQ